MKLIETDANDEKIGNCCRMMENENVESDEAL